jgi:hypothetical protein
MFWDAILVLAALIYLPQNTFHTCRSVPGATHFNMFYRQDSLHDWEGFTDMLPSSDGTRIRSFIRANSTLRCLGNLLRVRVESRTKSLSLGTVMSCSTEVGLHRYYLDFLIFLPRAAPRKSSALFIASIFIGWMLISKATNVSLGDNRLHRRKKTHFTLRTISSCYATTNLISGCNRQT